MKTAEEWLNVVGETVAQDMFAIGDATKPGSKTEQLIKQIQLDAREELLWDLCICSACGGEIHHHMDEPFYTCQKCGISGEATTIPKLQQMFNKGWKQGMTDAADVVLGGRFLTKESNEYMWAQRVSHLILTARDERKEV